MKGYMFRLYLSHLQAVKGQIHTIIPSNELWDPQQALGIPQCFVYNYGMDLTLEGLKMTQVESKHVALHM
jgi:hypothetical protein